AQLRMALEQRAEAAFRAPDALPLGVHVDEEAQDAGAVRRAIGARVDVHELVARARRELAALFLERPKARRPHRPARHEIGYGPAQERLDALAVRAKDPLDALFDFRGRVEARNRIGLRVIAHVLGAELARQPFTQEREVVLAGQLDRAALEEHDLGALERVLDLFRLRAVERAQLVS